MYKLLFFLISKSHVRSDWGLGVGYRMIALDWWTTEEARFMDMM